MAEGRVHGIPQQGVSIHIVESVVPGQNLRCADSVGQLLPGLQPLDGPVVNDPIWWPLPDNCMKVPSGGPPWRNDTRRGPCSDHTLPLRDSAGLAHKLSQRLWSPVCKHSPHNSGLQNQGGPSLHTPHLRVPQSYIEDQDNLVQVDPSPRQSMAQWCRLFWGDSG